MVRTFKIYSLCNFQVWDTLLLTRVNMLCFVPPGFIYTCKFVPFKFVPLQPCWLTTQTTELFTVFMFCSSWLLFDSTFKCDHIALVFLGLISYSITRSENINNLRYADDTTLMVESEEEAS